MPSHAHAAAAIAMLSGAAIALLCPRVATAAAAGEAVAFPEPPIRALLPVSPRGRPAAGGEGAPSPERPIGVLVPFPPGGATAPATRPLQPPFSSRPGQQIVINSRGGAQVFVGTQTGATAAPDGYTLVIAEIGAT